MIVEFWWKVFLASIVTVVIAKAFGFTWGIFLIFSVAFLAWTVLWLAVLWLLGLRQK